MPPNRKHTTINLPYNPMEKQAAAHALRAKYRSYSGGWGNGKTSWGCVETFARLHEFPGTKAIVSRKTRPELKSTTWDMLINGDKSQPNGWHGIPKETIEVYNKSDLYLRFKNGSEVYGLPLDDPAKIENYNLGFFWIDQCEEVEEDIFLKFHGRLRQMAGPREGIVTWNPAGHGWLWRRFLDPRRRPKWRKLYKGVEATTFDNPNLPDDYLDQFEGLPDAWLQRFVYGSHEVFVGQIFTDWDQDVHVIQPFHIPSDWPRWMCIDPGMRHEGAVSYVAFDYEGNAYYYRELLRSNQDVKWWSDQIHRMEAESDWGGPEEQIDRRFIGPEAQQRAQTDGRSVVEVFHSYGVFPELADRSPASRISRITERLRARDGHSHPFARTSPSPSLFVFSDCEKLLEYLPQYRWKPQRVNYSEEELPEAPRKKDDHNIDCLGHILVSAADFVPIRESSGRPVDPERALVEEMVEMAWGDGDDDAAEQFTSPEDYYALAHPMLGDNY